MKDAVYEILSIAKAEEVHPRVAANMFYHNCAEGEEQYIGTGEYDYTDPIKWDEAEMRSFNALYSEKGEELSRAFAEGDRKRIETIVAGFYN